MNRGRKNKPVNNVYNCQYKQCYWLVGSSLSTFYIL